MFIDVFLPSTFDNFSRDKGCGIVTIFSVLQAMVRTLHASLIENSSNHQINSQTKGNLRLKNGRWRRIKKWRPIQKNETWPQKHAKTFCEIIFCFGKWSILERKDCLRAIYRMVKQRIIYDHRRVKAGCIGDYF